MHRLGKSTSPAGVLSDRLLDISTVTELDTAREKAATTEG